jgi:hypothetical protein
MDINESDCGAELHVEESRREIWKKGCFGANGTGVRDKSVESVDQVEESRVIKISGSQQDRHDK